MSGQGEIMIQSLGRQRNKYKMFYSGKMEESFGKNSAGVGIIVKENLDCTFTSVNDRICFIKCKIKNVNHLIISAYAHTLPNSEKKPEDRAEFYEKLDSIINYESNSTQILIGGGI